MWMHDACQLDQCHTAQGVCTFDEKHLLVILIRRKTIVSIIMIVRINDAVLLMCRPYLDICNPTVGLNGNLITTEEGVRRI